MNTRPSRFGRLVLTWLFMGAAWTNLAFDRAADAQDYGASDPRTGIIFGGQHFGFDPTRVRRAGVESVEGGGPEGEWLIGEEGPTAAEAWEGDASSWDAGEPACGVDCTAFWARGEFLWWSMKGLDLPALATTGGTNGILPGATVLFGGTVNDETLPGARFTLGRWLDDCGCDGVEASFLMIGQASSSFRGGSPPLTLLARPFTDLDPLVLAPDARLIVANGVVDGDLSIVATTNFFTFDFLWRHNFDRSDCHATDLLIGYRHASLSDKVRIDESTTALATPIAGTEIDLFDQFATSNVFHGLQLGVHLQRGLGDRWSWDLLLKGAIGQLQSSVGATGGTRTTPSGDTSTFTDVGLLVQETNRGRHSTSEFGGLGELGLNLRRELNCGWSVNLGYSLIVWSDVMRAGDQIDTRINTTQLPPGSLTGEPLPGVPMATSTFWAHGVQIGVERAF